MDDTLGRNWWTFAVRGVVALALGAAIFAWPRISVGILIVLFGAYALDEAIFAFVGAVRASRRDERAWPLMLEGVLGLAVGVSAFLAPAAVARVLFMVIAGWAIFTGVVEVGAARRLRRVIKNEWWLALSGLVRIGFGVLLFARRGTGTYALAWLSGAYAFAYGFLTIGLSLRLKRHYAELHGGRSTTPRGWRPQHA